jgi:hypothetical protein
MSAMMELDLETLRFPRGRSVHFVKGRSGGDAPRFAYTFCGRSAHESHVVSQKYSQVDANRWCMSCYDNRRTAIVREVGA